MKIAPRAQGLLALVVLAFSAPPSVHANAVAAPALAAAPDSAEPRSQVSGLALRVPTDDAPTELAAEFDAFLDQHHALDQFSGAILVADRGRVVYQGARGMANSDWGVPNTPATKFRVASLTKQFTAMAVLLFVREGALDLDAPIGRYMPGYPASVGDRVTIRHLLNHTSGIPSYTNRPDFMDRDAKERRDVREFVATYCSDPLEFEPGTRFSYNNSGYFLLGAILENVAGRPYAEVLAERIFEPLGMTDSGVDDQYRVVPGRATGYDDILGGRRVATWMDMSTPFSAGAIYSTVGDLWKWDRALCDRTLLEGDLERAMTTPGLGGYGFGWQVETLPAAEKRPQEGAAIDESPPAVADRVVLYHGGGMPGVSTLIWRVPASGRCVIVLGNTIQTSALAIQRGVTSILDGRDPGDVRARGDYEIARTVLTDGTERALANLARWPENVREDFMKRDIAGIGRQLLAQGRVDQAIALGEFLTLAFPAAPEVWDALGHFQRTAGDREAALASYTRVVELDPDADAARALVDQLSAR